MLSTNQGRAGCSLLLYRSLLQSPEESRKMRCAGADPHVWGRAGGHRPAPASALGAGAKSQKVTPPRAGGVPEFPQLQIKNAPAQKGCPEAGGALPSRGSARSGCCFGEPKAALPSPLNALFQASKDSHALEDPVDGEQGPPTTRWDLTGTIPGSPLEMGARRGQRSRSLLVGFAD